MRLAALVLGGMLAMAHVASAQCNREIRRPQKAHDVVRGKWTAGGRTWETALSWRTLSVSDNGEEKADVVLAVRDHLDAPTIGDLKLYQLDPNRCDLPIDPQLTPVKLMGRDFLLVTLPDTRGTGGQGLVVAWMYSLDDKGKLHQVFQSAYEGHYMRTPQCRSLTKSHVRPLNDDGSRIAWVYEYPGVESVRKKSECARAKVERIEHTWEWKNGCFALEPDQPRHYRLGTDWDKVCVPGTGRAPKAGTKAPDGGAPPPAAPPDAGTRG